MLLLAGVVLVARPPSHAADAHPSLQLFVDAASQDEEKAEAALAALAESWRDGYAAVFLDFARFMRPRPQARMEGGPGHLRAEGPAARAWRGVGGPAHAGRAATRAPHDAGP